MKLPRLLHIWCLLFVVVMFGGCWKAETFKDYFPSDVGAKWVYKINTGLDKPLKSEMRNWPFGSGVMPGLIKGTFLGFINDRTQSTFGLIIKVKKAAAQQGPLNHPLGVEIEIEKDDLGVFDQSQQVFWAITEAESPFVIQVVTYSARTPGVGAPPIGMDPTTGSSYLDDGFSTRGIFYSSETPTEKGIGETPLETLLFTGKDSSVPECAQAPCLHFVRKVKRYESAYAREGEMNIPFSEDMWYAKGKGLVRLEQKANSGTLMTWTLSSFSQE